MPYNALKVIFTVSVTKLPVWLLQQSDDVRISVRSLRYTELTTNNKGYIQHNTGKESSPKH
jgi:hypothetical protein